MFNVFLLLALTTFTTFSRVFFLSPGFILSGLYPQKKSLFSFNLETLSIIGTQISSVQPGNTVDSKTIILFFFKYLPINLQEFLSNVKSGFLNLSIGVGTVTI